MTLTVQFGTLAAMVLSGLGLGAAFDGYRVVSGKIKIGKLWFPVLDLLYWLAATLVVFRILSASNEGELRAYVFLGLLIGIAFYFWLLSSIVISFMVWLINTIQRTVAFIARCLHLLVVRPLAFLLRLLRMALGLLWAGVLVLLRPLGKLLWWLAGPPLRAVWRGIEPLVAKLHIAERFNRCRIWLKKIGAIFFKR
ncbi:spore cortex biosynthesis protein YabQ [Paenibacillus sp. IB182496]|uniref:Spore cortex biosynthesis protein YabQ n=1 Tax=Paenibacillus sabuli TaxID=2772509 RepID=A0A927BZM3_9BACL|nr:spore cortex biosynthesis protein YabQ [Paenibacillus sabuli]MBD2848419.1 spore cortex biosynthesis protein YabQ [Paenibacillus sabuli]